MAALPSSPSFDRGAALTVDFLAYHVCPFARGRDYRALRLSTRRGHVAVQMALDNIGDWALEGNRPWSTESHEGDESPRPVDERGRPVSQAPPTATSSTAVLSVQQSAVPVSGNVDAAGPQTVDDFMWVAAALADRNLRYPHRCPAPNVEDVLLGAVMRRGVAAAPALGGSLRSSTSSMQASSLLSSPSVVSGGASLSSSNGNVAAAPHGKSATGVVGYWSSGSRCPPPPTARSPESMLSAFKSVCVLRPLTMSLWETLDLWRVTRASATSSDVSSPNSVLPPSSHSQGSSHSLLSSTGSGAGVGRNPSAHVSASPNPQPSKVPMPPSGTPAPKGRPLPSQTTAAASSSPSPPATSMLVISNNRLVAPLPRLCLVRELLAHSSCGAVLIPRHDPRWMEYVILPIVEQEAATFIDGPGGKRSLASSTAAGTPTAASSLNVSDSTVASYLTDRSIVATDGGASNSIGGGLLSHSSSSWSRLAEAAPVAVLPAPMRIEPTAPLFAYEAGMEALFAAYAPIMLDDLVRPVLYGVVAPATMSTTGGGRVNASSSRRGHGGDGTDDDGATDEGRGTDHGGDGSDDDEMYAAEVAASSFLASVVPPGTQLGLRKGGTGRHSHGDMATATDASSSSATTSSPLLSTRLNPSAAHLRAIWDVIFTATLGRMRVLAPKFFSRSESLISVDLTATPEYAHLDPADISSPSWLSQDVVKSFTPWQPVPLLPRALRCSVVVIPRHFLDECPLLERVEFRTTTATRRLETLPPAVAAAATLPSEPPGVRAAMAPSGGAAAFIPVQGKEGGGDFKVQDKHAAVPSLLPDLVVPQDESEAVANPLIAPIAADPEPASKKPVRLSSPTLAGPPRPPPAVSPTLFHPPPSSQSPPPPAALFKPSAIADLGEWSMMMTSSVVGPHPPAPRSVTPSTTTPSSSLIPIQARGLATGASSAVVATGGGVIGTAVAAKDVSHDSEEPTAWGSRVLVIVGLFLSWCPKLTTVDLSGLTHLVRLGQDVLMRCPALTSVNLSGMVRLQEVGSDFLNHASSLTTIDLSSWISVRRIRRGFLQGCERLKTVDLSPLVSLTQMGQDCFSHCSRLQSANFSGIAALHDIEHTFCADCPSLTQVDFFGATSLRHIGMDFCARCTSLRHIDISSMRKLRTLAAGAFSGCDHLRTVNLSQLRWLSVVGHSFMLNCRRVTEVSFAARYGPVDTLSAMFLNGCASLAKLDLNCFAATLTTIGPRVLGDCASLAVLDLSRLTQVTRIGDNFCSRCKHLKSVLWIRPLPSVHEATVASGHAATIGGAATPSLMSSSSAMSDSTTASMMRDSDDGGATISESGGSQSGAGAAVSFIRPFDVTALSGNSSATKLRRLLGVLPPDSSSMTSVNTAERNSSNGAHRRYNPTTDRGGPRPNELSTSDVPPSPASTRDGTGPSYGGRTATAAAQQGAAGGGGSAAAQLIHVGDSCFTECRHLEYVDFSTCPMISYIGRDFARGCTSLKSISLIGLSSLPLIRKYFANHCSVLTSVDLTGASCIESIEDGFLAECGCLIVLDLTPCNTSLARIGKDFMKGCRSLYRLDMSGLKALQRIGPDCFRGCGNVKTLLLDGMADHLKHTVLDAIEEAREEKRKQTAAAAAAASSSSDTNVLTVVPQPPPGSSAAARGRKSSR